MAEVFDFGIGITVDPGESINALDGVIAHVASLGEHIKSVNDAMGMTAIADSANELDNTLVGIEEHMGGIAGAGGGEGGGGFAAVDPASLETFEEMRDILRDIGAILVDISGDTERMTAASAEANAILGDISSDVAESADVMHEQLELTGPLLQDMSADLGEVADHMAQGGQTADELRAELDKVGKSGVAAAEDIADAQDGSSSSAARFLGFIEGMGQAWGGFAHAGKEAAAAVGGVLTGLTHDILDISDALQDLAQHGAFELERAAVRLGVSIGEGSEFNRDFIKSVNDVTQATGFAEAEITQLAQGLGAIGMASQVLDKEKMVFLTNLQQNLGLSVDEIQAFAGASKLMGASMEDMTATAMTFEKSFKVPGLVRQLPKAAQAAIKAQARFGRTVVGSSRRTATAVTRMAGVYAKALGKTAAQAADDALEAFNKFAGETRSFQNVFLGLADDFSPLQTAFLEAGMGIDEMGGLMKLAQTDQVAFVKQAQNMASAMDPFRRQRFLEQLRQELPAATAQMLNMTEAELKAVKASAAAASAEEERRKKQKDQLAVLGKTFDALRENVIDKFAKSSNKISGLINRVVRLFAGPLANSFDTLLDGVDGILTKFEKGEMSIAKLTDRSTVFSKVMGMVGGSAMGFSVALGAVATAAGFAMKFIRPLWTIIKGGIRLIKGVGKGINAILNGLNKAGSKVPGLSRIFGGAIGKFLVIPGLIISAIQPVRDAFDEIKKTIAGQGTVWEKFKGVVVSVFKAAGKTINNFFAGLPQTFLDGFNNMSADVSTKGAENFGKAIGSFLGKGMVAIIDWVSGTAIPWITTTGLPAIQSSFAALGTVEFWMKVLTGLAAVGHKIIAVFKGAAEGMLEAFGVPGKALVPMMELIWLKIQKFIIVGIMKVADVFTKSISGWRILFVQVGAYMAKTWEEVTSYMTSKMYRFVEGVLAGFREILQAASANAQALGLTTKTIDAGARVLQRAELSVLRSRRASEKASKKAVAQIEKERKKRIGLIIAEQKKRESVTAEVAKNYDKEIKAKQKIINQMATEKATQDALNKAKKVGIEAEKKAKAGPEGGKPGGPRSAGAGAAAVTGDKTAAETAGAAGSSAATQQMLQVLMQQLKVFTDLANSFAASGMATEALGARKQAESIVVQLKASGASSDYIKRALTAMEIETVNGKTK